MAKQASAIISYSHDSAEHAERVRALADRLRKDGVDCTIDAYEVSPPEGWPGWMRRQVQERDFCIVVCTETYARRFSGQETPGTGKGAVWEGQLLRQMLYEAGKNDHVVPVVFGRADVEHIPLELKGATRYDVSTAEGYERLHRALTAQPLVQPPPLGPVRRQLPALTAAERDCVSVLAMCPDPLPREVIARVAHSTATEVGSALRRLFDDGFVGVDSDSVWVVDRDLDGVPDPISQVIGFALEAELDFMKQHQRDPLGRAQLANAVKLALAADMHAYTIQVSRAFRVLHPILKVRGDKRVVLDVARRSIDASKLPGRTNAQVEDEAVALICGVSWVHQRTGRLEQARVDAERSLALGRDIGWERNTAFCHKCLGRLTRMEAEGLPDAGERAAVLAESEALLRNAIDRFTALGVEAEVGDCYSLLARTRLVANRLPDARDAAHEAELRLAEPGTKDYLDLQIVRADILAATNRRAAEAIYTDVLKEAGDDDAQKSEIFARAYLQRGKVRILLREPDAAAADLQQAAAIWGALNDPAADTAHWELERVSDTLDRDTVRQLEAEAVAVRVRVARLARERAAGRKATAKRAKLTQQYLQGLIGEAREQLAVERPAW